MIIHIILDPEQLEVVFMTPSNVAFNKVIAGLRDEMINYDMIEEDDDYSAKVMACQVFFTSSM